MNSTTGSGPGQPDWTKSPAGMVTAFEKVRPKAARSIDKGYNRRTTRRVWRGFSVYNSDLLQAGSRRSRKTDEPRLLHDAIAGELRCIPAQFAAIQNSMSHPTTSTIVPLTSFARHAGQSYWCTDDCDRAGHHFRNCAQQVASEEIVALRWSRPVGLPTSLAEAAQGLVNRVRSRSHG